MVVELRARFDEAANIDWANILTDAGVKVVFGVPSLQDPPSSASSPATRTARRCATPMVGTGNFNEKTAKITPTSPCWTRHPDITAEVESVFEYIEYPYRRYKFNHPLVSPINSRRQLYRLSSTTSWPTPRRGNPAASPSRSTIWWTRPSSTGSMPPARPGCPSIDESSGMCAPAPGGYRV